MRIPLLRSGGDPTPIAWWEYVFMPIMFVFLLVFAIIGAMILIPYYWLYPERHAQEIDVDGTPEERERLEAFRDYRGRVSLWRRFLEKVHLAAYDGGPHNFWKSD